MYIQDYLYFLGAIIICAIFSGIASSKVHSAYNKFSQVPNRSGMTGQDAVRRMMQSNNVHGISIGRTGGSLTDHYHPKNAVIKLSEDTYSGRSVAAVAVAAHEMGHVMQKEEEYLFYNIRTALVPIVNFGTLLSMPLVLVGILIDWYSATAGGDLGFTVAMIGVILYGGSLLFSLVTLPVELDASRRAKQMLLADGILTEDELPGAGKVLSAAALTYLASLLTSLVYFLRFLLRVLSIFGRRNNR